MVVRISDKTQNYSEVTKLLVKPYIFHALKIIMPISFFFDKLKFPLKS